MNEGVSSNEVPCPIPLGDNLRKDVHVMRWFTGAQNTLIRSTKESDVWNIPNVLFEDYGVWTDPVSVTVYSYNGKLKAHLHATLK